MDPTPRLPADWDRFLDTVGRDLGVFLDKAKEREEARAVDAARGFVFPLAECMQQVHEGMDARIGRLEIHLKELDQHLGQAEAEAQQMQAGSRQLRDR